MLQTLPKGITTNNSFTPDDRLVREILRTGRAHRLIRAEDSDLFDVLEYVAYAAPPVSRTARADQARRKVMPLLDASQQEFIEFVLSRYVQAGVAELDTDKLPALLELKYRAVADAVDRLGSISAIRSSFIDFQGYLYERAA